MYLYNYTYECMRTDLCVCADTCISSHDIDGVGAFREPEYLCLMLVSWSGASEWPLH